jgi:hypothetical protein
MRTQRLVVLALASTALAGCGTSDRAPDAAAVAERFHDAIGRQDGEAACREVAVETASKLEQEEARPCEDAILELDLPGEGRSVQTSVYAITASVSLAAGGRTFLDEFDDGWKVSAAGCVPTAPDLPYDCELEG